MEVARFSVNRCAFLPVSLSWPAGVVKKRLAATGTRVLFTDDAAAGVFCEQTVGVPTVRAPIDWEDPGWREHAPLWRGSTHIDRVTGPETYGSVAIIFTSGSTAEPKGVVLANTGE